MAEYRLHYTEAFLVESFERYRKQQTRFWWHSFKLTGFVGIAVLLSLCLYDKLLVPAALLAALLVLLLLGRHLDYWFMRRRFRRSPFYNNNVLVAVYPDGYISRSANGTVELSWRAFTKVRRFKDGFLVFTGPQQFDWWPDAALCRGNLKAVEAIVRSEILDYEITQKRKSLSYDSTKVQRGRHTGYFIGAQEAPAVKKAFSAKLERHPGAGTWTYYVTVPFSAEKAFGIKGRIAVRGKIESTKFHGILRPYGDGRHLIVVNKAIRDSIGKEAGSAIRVEIEYDAAAHEIGRLEAVAAVANNGKPKAIPDGLSYARRKEYV
jgi:hypothetical protein